MLKCVACDGHKSIWSSWVVEWLEEFESTSSPVSVVAPSFAYWLIHVWIFSLASRNKLTRLPLLLRIFSLFCLQFPAMHSCRIPYIYNVFVCIFRRETESSSNAVWKFWDIKKLYHHRSGLVFSWSLVSKDGSGVILKQNGFWDNCLSP